MPSPTPQHHHKLSENETTMPLRLWPKRSKRKNLETRVRRLEKEKKRFTTTLDVCNHWDEMASANGLTRRIAALETWQENTDTVLLRLMEDLTVAERKLNRILPGDDSDGGDEDEKSGRSAFAGTSSLDVSSENNVGPSPMLAPGETPVTFTRRKSDSAERVTLDGSGLRLSQSARTI